MTQKDVNALKADINTVVNNTKKAKRLETLKILWKIFSHYGSVSAPPFIEELAAGLDN